MNGKQKQAVPARKKREVVKERLIAYRLRDRDLTNLIIIERCSMAMHRRVTEILLRMLQGEHRSTKEEFKDDVSGHWSIETFLKEWQVNQKKLFEYRAV